MGLSSLAPTSGAVAAQAPANDRGTIVIVVGAETTTPVPTLSSFQANVDVAELLFLRLARPGKGARTRNENEFVPELARSWKRRDSVTLAFDLDPRATWQDGVPVTSRDLVWSLNRARDSIIAPDHALLLREIASVSAEGDRRVVVRFKRAYPEQFFDATWHAPPLPAHLIDTIPAGELAKSPWAKAPIASGPYRFVRRDPGRQIELAAVPNFFLGAPKLERVIFLIASDADAQLNLMLSGQADGLQNHLLLSSIPRIMAAPSLRIVTSPSHNIAYLLFNQRANGDRSAPHPILSDQRVRRAISLAIDRERIVHAIFGPYASVTNGPFGSASWVRPFTPKLPPTNPRAARRLLREAGWTDTDGDGIADKDGRPLTLQLQYPGSNVPRVAVAPVIQAMLRDIGIKLELVRLEGRVWAERRGKGQFDIDFSQVTLDPTPSGLVQSWTCAGRSGSNRGQWCNPQFDSLLTRAINTKAAPAKAWGDAIRVLQNDAPAVFLFTPMLSVVLQDRYRNVTVTPERTWGLLWQWSVDPKRRIGRDDGSGPAQ